LRVAERIDHRGMIGGYFHSSRVIA
jgi:hypothetical protein